MKSGVILKSEMAKLSREDVLKLARLSRLELSDEEVDEFLAEFNEILGYVEQLQNVDVSALEPTDQVTGLKDVMRTDEIMEYEASPEELMNCVPEKENGHIKTKRIL